MAGTEHGGDDDGALEALLGEVARAPARSPASDLHGRTLGRYRIDATLGRGGMGIVYRAFDTKLAREVAVKVLAPEVLGDRERRARFVREARVAASLEAASTAAVYDVGEEGEIVWIAMELVRGRGLRTLIDEHPSGLSSEEAVRLGMQIARGLAFAHDRGVVHRDLKPENVMVDETGRTKILDFGLAKLRDVAGAEGSALSAEHGHVLGTPSYMSPEQAKGRRVDHRSDLFSLGVVLYEMLSGRRPFVGETTMEVLIAIDRDAPAPLGELRRDLDRRLIAVVDRCLAKRAEDRWQHARDVVTALEPFESSVSRRRRPTLVYAGVLAVAAVAVAAMVGARASRITPAGEKGTAASGAAPPPSLEGKPGTLACPPLEASGVEAPVGWLGAAAASTVCRRAVWMRGGTKKLTLAPADLLTLPPTPSDGLDFDVYGAPDARTRAIAAARARASEWMDGSVVRTRDGFDVHLEMKAPDDRVLARGNGSGRSLLVAVRAAMTPLGLPVSPLEDEVARWTGVRDPMLAVAIEDYLIEEPMGTRTTFAELERRKPELGPDWAAIAFTHAAYSCAIDTNVAAPALDRSSPSLFARTALARARVANDVGLPVADELHALAEREVSPMGRRDLLRAEALVRYTSGETDRIRAILLPSVQVDPRDPTSWDAITTVTYGEQRALYGYTKSYTAWVPEHPDAWNTQAHAMIEERERAFAYYRRAYELGSESPLMALNYVRRLIERGRHTDARSVAARLLAGGEQQRHAAEAVLLLADVGDARFGAAIDRGRGLGEALPTLGAVECAGSLALLAIVEMAPHVGRGTNLADALVERFVLAEPRRLTRGHFAAAEATMLCGFARPALARTCLDRVERLVVEGWFREGVVPPTRELMTGLGHWLRGDAKQAATAWRPLLAARWWARLPYVVEAFERAGDEEAAERADAPAAELTSSASLAHVRAARRAAKRGDVARAKALSKHVIDAWGAADVPVDVVRDLRIIAGAAAASPAR